VLFCHLIGHSRWKEIARGLGHSPCPDLARGHLPAVLTAGTGPLTRRSGSDPVGRAGATWIVTDFGMQPTEAEVREVIDAGPG
jgi:hypothetical protein